jgi:predicted DsbA family dithiol-disulfide isomerase
MEKLIDKKISAEKRIRTAYRKHNNKFTADVRSEIFTLANGLCKAMSRKEAFEKAWEIAFACCAKQVETELAF